MRNISLNTHYFILFNNPSYNQQIATLARQMYPGQCQFLVEAFRDAATQPQGYLITDLKPTTHDLLRLRTGLIEPTVRFQCQVAQL